MEYRKVAGPIRIDSANGGVVSTIRLSGRAGGRAAKVVFYDVVVLGSSGDNVRLSIDVYHGPRSEVLRLHSAAMTDAQPGTTYPVSVGGQGDTSLVLSEYIEPRIKIRDSATTTPQWALVEVYEMRKPF